MDKKFLAGSTLEELTAYLKNRGEAAFRAKQITGWLYDKIVLAPEEMKNLPASLKAALKEDFFAYFNR